jgi:hypothetical protein
MFSPITKSEARALIDTAVWKIVLSETPGTKLYAYGLPDGCRVEYAYNKDDEGSVDERWSLVNSPGIPFDKP